MTKPQENTESASGLTLGFVASGTIVIIALWALANAIWLARDVFFITFFAVLVASFLSIIVEPLERRGVKRAISAPLVLLLLLALFAGLFALIWPTLSEQFTLIRRELPAAIASAQTWFEKQMSSLSAAPVGQPERKPIAISVSTMLGGTLPLLNSLFGAITGTVLVLAAGMFIAISPRTYMHGLIVLLPKSKRKHAGEVLPMAGQAMVGWLKGISIGMLIIGSMSAIGLWALGIPAALALGIIAGILEFIPYVGPALSFVPALIIAYTISPEKMLWVVGLYILVQGLESNVVIPLLMKEMAELPPALLLLFQAVMATLFGFLGLLLAVPILAASKILVQIFYVEDVADEL